MVPGLRRVACAAPAERPDAIQLVRVRRKAAGPRADLHLASRDGAEVPEPTRLTRYPTRSSKSGHINEGGWRR